MQAAPARPPAASAANRRLSLVLGVVLAVVAFIGVAGLGLYVSQSNNQGTVSVLVASQDIQPRQVVTADMVKTVSVPQSGLQPNAILHTSDLNGRAAAVTISSGQQITTNLLFSNSGLQSLTQQAYLPIPKGWVARAITTGEIEGVGGYIQAGDYLNVIASLNQSVFNTQGHQNQKAANVSKTTFTNVRVIEVGPAGQNKSSSQSLGVTSSLTVILTQCDAEYFDWLLNNAKLTYTILSYHDYNSAPPSQPVAACPPTTQTGVGPDQVDARYHFTAI